MIDAPVNWPFPTFKGKALDRKPLVEDTESTYVPLWDSVKSQRKEAAHVVSEADDCLF